MFGIIPRLVRASTTSLLSGWKIIASVRRLVTRWSKLVLPSVVMAKTLTIRTETQGIILRRI
jgi:hypothetical protein